MTFRGVYAITDSTLLPGNKLIESVTQALQGGISLLQYRNKAGSPDERLNQARVLRAVCDRYSVPLIINDDIQLCLDSGAKGLHIGQSDTDLHQARSLLGNQAIIGVTCHGDIGTALKAQLSGADYVAFGRFFPSVTKPAAPVTELSVLRQANEKLSIPIVAIGGINAKNAQLVIDAGADMIAVINYLFEDNNVKRRARLLADFFIQ